MEPFMMMLGYGLVNSLSQLVVRPIADKLSASGRQEEMKMQMETKHALDLEAVRLNKEIELENQRDIQAYCHQLRSREAQSQFERQLQMWQIGNFNDKMWPLLTPYDHPSLRPVCNENRPVPVNIFLAKTDPRSPFSAFIQPDLKNRLSNFLQTAYVNDPLQQHPCICRIGDWKDGFQDAAFINALWYGMQGQPTIVVNPIQSEFGETLDLNVSIWGLGETGIAPRTQNVLTGSFASAIGRIKREKTKFWVSHGLPVDSKEMTHNVNLLKQEEKMVADGNGQYIDRLLIQYHLPKEIQTEVVTEFSSEYNHLISCITGMYADIYHLIEYGARPYMPVAMNQYSSVTGGKFQIPEVAILHYRKALTDMTCTNYLQDKLPFAFLGVAKSLSFSPGDSMQIFNEGVGLWANRKLDLHHEVELPTKIDDSIRLLYDNATDTDKRYLEAAKDVLMSMGQGDAARSLDRKISVLVTPVQQKQATEYFETEWSVRNQMIFTYEDFLKWVNSNKGNAMLHGAAYAILALRNTYFAMMFLNKDARFVSVENMGGQCIIAQRYYLPDEIVCENLVIFDLSTNSYVLNKEIFMENKDFDSFERLGRQLDTLVNNLGKLVKPSKMDMPQQDRAEKPSAKNEFERQIFDLFTAGKFSTLESENCDVAEFDAVKNWVTSKLPVKDAVNAHIYRTTYNGKVMVCIFFSDVELNALFGGDYPMKRILCNRCDSNVEAFLNGLSIGTLKL